MWTKKQKRVCTFFGTVGPENLLKNISLKHKSFGKKFLYSNKKNCFNGSNNQTVWNNYANAYKNVFKEGLFVKLEVDDL